MRKVSIEWLPAAQIDKGRQIDYIGERNALAALGIDEHIRQQLDQLASFPFLGRKGRIPDTYELVISRTPYIVAYRVTEDRIQILHLFHGSQTWPPQD